MVFSDPAPIDCDIHPVVPKLAALMPYLDDHWRDTVIRRGIEDLTTISYPTRNPLSFRQDWRDETGRTATDAATLGRQALDPFGTRLAICNCLYGVQAQFSEDLGVAMARALNDWIAREWLDRDPRLRASIVVPMQNAEMAVDEINRCAPDRRFVQVMLLVGSESTLGRRQNWPIYAAAERHGLPVGIHAGSMYRHPMTPVGWPTTFTEEYVSQATAFQSQLTSLITEGVFARFPTLTVVLMESGVSWLPAYLWRLTKFWKGLRSEVPWVSDPPTSIVRDRVRLTLQPFDAPPDPASVMRLIEHIGSDEMLLFSTDYPHYQFDGEQPIPEGLDKGLARKIMAENPLRTYVRLKDRGDFAMNVDVLNRSGLQAAPASRLAIADCDIHPRPSGVGIGGVSKALYPYLSQRWIDHVEEFGITYRQQWEKGSSYPKGQPQACRRDAYLPDGGSPGSDLGFMAEQHLDPNNVALGILNPLTSGQGATNPLLSAAICHATNEWEKAEWTSRDKRLRASVVVPYEDTAASVKEIELRAPDTDFAQVLLLSRSAEPLGQRRYWPIYEAAAAANLAVGIHAFGNGGWANTAGGWGSYYIEEMVGHAQAQQALLVSMILEGVFEAMPNLRVVLVEGGLAWAAALGWRMDRQWAKLKRELPHLKRAPSEYIRSNVWFTTQPVEEPEPRHQLAEALDWIGWDRILFATDYPHWDYDDPAHALPLKLTEAQRRAVFVDNAKAVYRPA